MACSVAALTTSSSVPAIVSEQLVSLGNSRQSMTFLTETCMGRVLLLRSSSGLFGVVGGAEPVDDDGRLITDHPRIVAPWQRRDVARAGDELGPVVHPDAEFPGDVVLKVRRLAAGRFRQRLHVGRPAPTGPEDQSTDLGAADVEDFGSAVGELADLVRPGEGLVFGSLLVAHHRMLLCGCEDGATTGDQRTV